MEQRHRDILRRHKSNLEKDLEPKSILSKLTTVLDENEEEEIKAQSPRKERCDKLFEILPRKGPNAFKVFVEALNEQAPYLAAFLTEADDAETARVQSANLREKIQNLQRELEEVKQNHAETLQELKTEVIQQLRDECSSRCESLKKERDSTRRKNQTLEKEIQELKKKSEDDQRENQALQKEQQEKIRQLQTKNEELEGKVTNRTSGLKEVLEEIFQQQKDESCSRCEALRNERDSTIKEIHTLGEQIQELKKGITKIIKDNQLNTQTPLRRYQEETKDLQGKNKKLLEDLEKSKKEKSKLGKELEKSQRDLEEAKKDLACEKDRVKDCQQKFEEESNAKDDLLEQKLKNETRMSEENNRVREKLKEERSKSDNLRKEVHRLRLTTQCAMPGRIYKHSKDFDKRGVVYALTTNSGKTSEIVATRSSDGEGNTEDLLENQVKNGTVSGTKDKEDSWWLVDLTEKYLLYLTHYTLRHGRDRSMSVLLNWRLEGSLDGSKWITLKNHEDDHGLKEHRPYCTCTWAFDGYSNAFRYFRIFQTGKNSSGRFGISLSGIELYGVLIEKSS